MCGKLHALLAFSKIRSLATLHVAREREGDIHDLMMQNYKKKKYFPHKTPILALSFAACAISLVPRTCDISRFESVSGLYDHPVYNVPFPSSLVNACRRYRSLSLSPSPSLSLSHSL
jgi:hypothetical protein